MEEQELKRKIQLLYAVKPREDWVFSVRRQLLEKPLQKQRFSFIIRDVVRMMRLLERPMFVMPALALVVALGAVWQASGASLPGDALYGLKTATEGIPLQFSSAEERPFLQIELAQKRLGDLKRIAQDNRVRNLPSAIKEFEDRVSVVSASVSSIVENQPERALQAGVGIVQLQKEKSEIEQILGTKIGEEETLQDATRKLVEYELVDLQDRSLGEEQQRLLQEAGDLISEGKYAEALEKIWEISNIEG